MTVRYLHAFAHRQTLGSGCITIVKEQITTFAANFDPQPFHLDEIAAQQTPFQALAANGGHTAALTMRRLVDGDLGPVGGILGAGLDELRWPRPVRPGDELYRESEVLDIRPSKSRPSQGMIKLHTKTLTNITNRCKSKLPFCLSCAGEQYEVLLGSQRWS